MPTKIKLISNKHYGMIGTLDAKEIQCYNSYEHKRFAHIHKEVAMPQAKTVSIPHIADDELRQLIKIKPVVRFRRVKKELIPGPHGELYYIENIDPHDIRFMDSRAARKTGGRIQFLADIKTLHPYILPSFKPSIAEVLAQIPKEYLYKTIAFEVVGKPDVITLETGELCYKATVRLFEKKKR